MMTPKWCFLILEPERKNENISWFSVTDETVVISPDVLTVVVILEKLFKSLVFK